MQCHRSVLMRRCQGALPTCQTFHHAATCSSLFLHLRCHTSSGLGASSNNSTRALRTYIFIMFFFASPTPFPYHLKAPCLPTFAKHWDPVTKDKNHQSSGKKGTGAASLWSSTLVGPISAPRALIYLTSEL